jgi:Ssp1 endopeptidase immunity protein Rap1a
MRYAVAIMLLALTLPASAQSANTMMPACKAYVDGVVRPFMDAQIEFFEYGRCFGFVEGLAYTGAFCVPSGVNKNQAVAVVIKYIEARPERMHERFGDLALEALTAAWPCKR